MSTQSSQPHVGDIVATYRTKLKDEWTYQAYCGREYVLVPELKRWMLATESGYPENNATRLLRAVHRGDAWLAVVQGILDCALIVFGILLADETNDAGYAIYDFHDLKIDDRLLSWGLDQVLDKLSTRRPELTHIILTFKKRRWAFCPLILDIDMGIDCSFAEQILPFCERQKVNGKGGTADVWQVLIKEALVSDRLKQRLKHAAIIDRTHGDVSKTLSNITLWRLLTFLVLQVSN